MRGSLIGAGIILLFDGVLEGSGEMSILVGPIWLLVAIIRGIIGHKNWRLALARILIPLVAIFIVCANARVQSKMAQAKAETIISACFRYQSDNGKLPDRLSQFVPKYLPSIPPPKYVLFPTPFSGFRYYSNGEVHWLDWIVLPQFGHKTYDFEHKKWSYYE